MEHEASFLSAFLGLVFVLGIIFLITYLFKRFGPAVMTGAVTFNKKSSITLLDAKNIDPKNRLVLIQCKNKEYLLLTGQSNTLIDTFEIEESNLSEEKENRHADN